MNTFVAFIVVLTLGFATHGSGTSSTPTTPSIAW